MRHNFLTKATFVAFGMAYKEMLKIVQRLIEIIPMLLIYFRGNIRALEGEFQSVPNSYSNVSGHFGLFITLPKDRTNNPLLTELRMIHPPHPKHFLMSVLNGRLHKSFSTDRY